MTRPFTAQMRAHVGETSVLEPVLHQFAECGRRPQLVVGGGDKQNRPLYAFDWDRSLGSIAWQRVKRSRRKGSAHQCLRTNFAMGGRYLANGICAPLSDHDDLRGGIPDLLIPCHT